MELSIVSRRHFSGRRRTANPTMLITVNRFVENFLIEGKRFVSAVYLCKRTMQNKTRLELADYEAENLARLQKLFARKWELIYLQAEAQIK